MENLIHLIIQLLAVAFIIAIITERLTEAYISKFDIDSIWLKHIITIVLNISLICFAFYYYSDKFEIFQFIFLLIISVAGSEVSHNIRRKLIDNNFEMLNRESDETFFDEDEGESDNG